METFYEYDYSEAMDAIMEQEEWDRMEEWNDDQMDRWDRWSGYYYRAARNAVAEWDRMEEWNEEQSLNEVRETTGEEDTQEEEYTGVEEDHGDNDSVTTVVIHPSDTKTTGQGAYVYCRPRPFYNNIIGFDSD